MILNGDVSGGFAIGLAFAAAVNVAVAASLIVPDDFAPGTRTLTIIAAAIVRLVIDVAPLSVPRALPVPCGSGYPKDAKSCVYRNLVCRDVKAPAPCSQHIGSQFRPGVPAASGMHGVELHIGVGSLAVIECPFRFE